jgi:hypothetical protein
VLQLKITIREGFDETAQQFVASETIVLPLEHSLVSLSKWESKWELPFLGSDDKTDEQVLDYVRMMFSGDVFPEQVIPLLKAADFDKINDYINAKMTATWFNERQQPPSREIVTAELIYYWMISLGVPFECQYWHLNRLLTLIKVCSIKSKPPEKVDRATAMRQRAELNAQRRAAMNSRG